MSPKIFGTEHLVFLAIFVVFMIVSLVLIKKFVKSEKAKSIMVRLVAFVLFAFIAWNRISITVLRGNWNRLIPNTFCGLDSLVIALAVLFGKKNNGVLHFVVYVTFVGGLGTLLYPDFIDTYNSIFHTIKMSGLLHHAFSLYLCILLQMVGWITPNYKKWKNLIVGFLAYITLGAFLMSVLDVKTAFYINEPLIDGTILNIWVLAPIFAVGYALYMFAYEFITKKKWRKKPKNSYQIILSTLKKDI